MNRRYVLTLLAGSALTACAPPPPSLGPDGQPLPRAYRISGADARRIPFRALDAVNALRTEAGAVPVQLDDRLTAAAATHSRDMSLQNRPWHFGSDGSSPIDRARRAGFQGRLLGETISETYESELETIVAWGQQPGPRRVLLDPAARRMGFAYYQEQNGKIWWTLNMGTDPGAGRV
ncbi:CAP domain-containing protein [Jannaschia aquimarina]|uniref:Cysteine-rich secretory protein family protein n=1 Tax=Jannaschia aquimarina TaxID=935700 RepID=A0A0D1CK56_9RHOB|nr:CAP domain-containing protein [Jannaschia aquimarina]KIT15127.1 Cysteine-rich secretory protein family protein [Jannaschia aquimarina]SNS64802.1 Cysteine-rich secretory protein family protein [Jannaschia aquimarina]